MGNVLRTLPIFHDDVQLAGFIEHIDPSRVIYGVTGFGIGFLLEEIDFEILRDFIGLRLISS